MDTADIDIALALRKVEAQGIVDIKKMFPDADSEILREAMLIAQRNAYRELHSVSMGMVHELTARMKSTEDRLYKLMNERREAELQYQHKLSQLNGTECRCPDCACGP
jgi:Tfp pilus assembly ATPase PilU